MHLDRLRLIFAIALEELYYRIASLCHPAHKQGPGCDIGPQMLGVYTVF
jgi:hypothetical protein